MKFNGDALLKFLKALPAISFAIMLGAGVVATCFAIWYTYIIAYRTWPESAVPQQLGAVTIGLYISLGLIGAVLFVLAFGKIDSLKITTATGIGGEIDFDEDHSAAPQVVTTTTTTVAPTPPTV
jgi:amino acid permease